MAVVDMNDDSIMRYVILHHKYSLEHKEYKYLPIIAYDNEDEFDVMFEIIARDIRHLDEIGISNKQTVVGQYQEPGFLRNRRKNRLMKRMRYRNGINTFDYFFFREHEGIITNSCPLNEPEPPLRHIIEKYLNTFE